MKRKRKKRGAAVVFFLGLAAQQVFSIPVYASRADEVENAFKEYLGTVLVPIYGVLQTDTAQSSSSHNWTEENLTGILASSIMDFDQDGQLEMLTVRFSDYNKERGVRTLFLEMYEYEDSGEISVGALKNINLWGYSFGDIGYRQNCIFTYEYQGERYIGIDNYHNGNGSEVALSVFGYGKSEPQEVIVPHTSEVVYRKPFDYIGGAGYELRGGGDIFVRYAEREPENPLSCEQWSWERQFSIETDPLLTDEEKEEYMNVYKSLLEQYGLQAADERIGMSENGKLIFRSEIEGFETAPDIYQALEGEITFLSGMYTDQGADTTTKELSKFDYQGSLDEFRNNGEEQEE